MRHTTPRLFAAVALVAALVGFRARAAQGPPPSAADDPLAELVREVRKDPAAFSYSRLAIPAAREIYPDLTQAAERQFEEGLDRLAERLKPHLGGARTGKEKVALLAALMVQAAGLRNASEGAPEHESPDHYFPHVVLARKQGVCMGLSLIYLAVSERAGLPIRPAHAPQHLYVLYDDGRERWHVETSLGGQAFDEAAYRARHVLAPQAEAKGSYFRALGKLEVLGDLLNAISWFSAIRTAPRPLPPERAVLAARLCVELGPDDFNNWDTLAQALSYAGRPAEALAMLRRALELRPPVGPRDEAYWQDRLRRFTDAARQAQPQPRP